MIGALIAKTLIIQGINQGDQGILGGPIALAAPQINIEQALLDAGSEASGESLPLELSTGSLDGAGFLALAIEESEEIVGSGSTSVKEENDEVLEVAKKIVKDATPAVAASQPAAASGSRYFIQPASGRNWGVRHGYNAVDIANSCGTPVNAAAAGVVVSDRALGSGASGYNGGYGRFVLIEHSNGTKTRYAHLSKIYVTVGQSVSQGEQVGAIGNNGNVQGSTGCHLHFEVIGAANPFAKS